MSSLAGYSILHYSHLGNAYVSQNDWDDLAAEDVAYATATTQVLPNVTVPGKVLANLTEEEFEAFSAQLRGKK